MDDFGTDKELFRLLFGDLAGTLGFLLGTHLLVLLQFAQLVGQGVGLAFHFLCQRPGFGAGGFQLIFSLLDQLIALLPSCFQLIGRLVAQFFHLVLTGFQLQFQVIQLAKNRIQTLILGRQMLLRRLNDPLRDAELFADEECVRFAGHTDAQLVSRAQRLQIKFTACIDHALGLEGKHFQFGIVGRRHQQHSTAAQLFDDGNGQSRALRRVSACAQLIQKNQRMRHGQLEDAGDLLHVTREGR